MRSVLLAAIALFFVGSPVAADYNESAECGAFGSSSPLVVGVVQVGEDPRATFYIDDRYVPFGYGIWIYQESNGAFDPSWRWIENLQRGGSATLDGHPEICDDNNPAGPDTLIY
jgi:hypothetical protein